jgi:tetratricopeptide (TPR) repeat protein
MRPQPFTMNPSYLAMVRGVRELHRLIAEGKEDSSEADAIRDATDGPWESLSEIERRRARNLSEDLYSLHELAAVPGPPNPQTFAKLVDALEARKQGEWDRALDLLRQWGSFVDDPATVSYVRGEIWLEAGDAATAVLFFEHASKLQPDNESYRAMLLHALSLSDPDEAQRRAEAILVEPEKSPAVVIAHAANIDFKSLANASESEATSRFQRLVRILESTLSRFEQEGLSTVDRSSYVMTITNLGLAHEFLGEAQLASQSYSRGLQIEPGNDVLLVARGMLLYGTSARAITDFEEAVRLRSPVIWPYFFLAHDHLQNNRFEECRRLGEQALELPGSAAVKSELSEWIAISQEKLGFPEETVRASFETAIRLDPSNERAGRNFSAFEAAGGRTIKGWVTRSPAAVRSSGLAERRYKMAA